MSLTGDHFLDRLATIPGTCACRSNVCNVDTRPNVPERFRQDKVTSGIAASTKRKRAEVAMPQTREIGVSWVTFTGHENSRREFSRVAGKKLGRLMESPRSEGHGDSDEMEIRIICLGALGKH